VRAATAVVASACSLDVVMKLDIYGSTVKSVYHDIFLRDILFFFYMAQSKLNVAAWK
jgi:hypothetical protein